MSRVELFGLADAPLLARPFYGDGDPGPIVTSLAQVPELLRDAMPFLASVLGPGAVDARTKEIVILRTSAVMECRFCVATHTVVARDVGLSLEEVRALRGHGDLSAAFTASTDQSLIAWTDAVAAGRGPVADDVAAALAEDWNDHLVVELTLLVATTVLLNRYCSALELPISEETLRGLAVDGFSEDPGVAS